MSKLVRIALLLLLVLAILGTVVGISLFRASQHVPDFYVEALETEPEEMEKAGDELERRVLALQNEINHDGRWQAIFTTEQINGWLAADLAEKFPGLLPANVSQPRVAIVEGELQVACRHEGQGVNTIISFTLEPYLTENRNEVAVRMRSLRAGALPLPMSKVLDRVSNAAGRADLRLQWAQEEGDPIALVTLPESRPELLHDYHVEELTVADGQIVITGYTGPAPEPTDNEEEVAEAMQPKIHSAGLNVNTNSIR